MAYIPHLHLDLMELLLADTVGMSHHRRRPFQLEEVMEDTDMEEVVLIHHQTLTQVPKGDINLLLAEVHLLSLMGINNLQSHHPSIDVRHRS